MPLFPSRRKGLGALIEGPRETRAPGIEKLRLGKSMHSSATLEHFIPTVDGRRLILDQGATSSCVAHAFIAAIHIAEVRARLPFAPCSRLFAYYNARRLMDPQVLPIVDDSGTYPRTCAEGLAKFGVPDEEYWPFSTFTFKVNRRPNYTAMTMANPRTGGSYVKIYERGDQRLSAIESAIVAGHPVVFGTTVRESFLDMHGPDFVQIQEGDIAGGHAMAIVGFEPFLGRMRYRVLNSWGPKWRDGGLVWLDQSLIASDEADDFHVLYGWKRLQGLQGA